ncbi:MAG: hypothetical protein ABIN80_21345 [Dyadobacter sp.]|uniref:hypothetical protein n=1 Tax=Dyadobacter sp. TaxID=1914288 RepID=UPI003266BBC1
MKTLIASVLLTVSMAVSSTGFAHGNPAASASTAQNDDTKFSVVTGKNGKIDVTVIKSDLKTVSVKVVDKSGHTLANKMISKGNAATRTRFDLNQLPDGAYQVILIEGDNQQVKDIELNTQDAETLRTVSLG